jgi:uncharacterized integral membrane protein (TIGR00698 family)
VHRDEKTVPRKRTATTFDWAALLPGLILCILIASICSGLESLERHAFDHPYVEALVMAILVGMAIRGFWTPSARWQSGIAFSAKQLLELAVMLLGASISFAAIAASGLLLLGAIVLTVILTLAISYSVSRVLGLPIRLSILIACGNSICGNSAIAAVAPVIGADRDDIAASISFTAILGVVIVLGLPLLIPLLRLSATQYGILAGLTVYAVPQVLAATMPAGLISAQVGTLVKLIRVLMLGPVVVALSLVVPRWFGNKTFAASRKGMTFLRFVPWFIVGFLLLSALRSFAIIPAKPAMLIAKVTGFLTIVSMAALGLGVDIRVLAQVGGRVTAAVTLSLMFLLALSIAIVFFFR